MMVLSQAGQLTGALVLQNAPGRALWQRGQATAATGLIADYFGSVRQR
jgi:hypothetical protein